MPKPLSALREKMQKRLELLEMLEEAIQNDPAIGKMIRTALDEHYGEEPKQNGTTVKRRGRPKTGDFEALAKVLSTETWVSTPDLRDKSGLTKSKIATLLQAHSDRLESRTDPDNSRRLQWRLKS